ncbi:hypothetical protein SCH4B_0474 [Ruegeria sp. TrichCH4B]|nr:hypothetical protein SCH4B_0474 [Ruegeria sp. TrichCH4B]
MQFQRQTPGLTQVVAFWAGKGVAIASSQKAAKAASGAPVQRLQSTQWQ